MAVTKHNCKKVTWESGKWGPATPEGAFLKRERTGTGMGKVHIVHNDGSSQEWSCPEGTSALEGNGAVALPEGAVEVT